MVIAVVAYFIAFIPVYGDKIARDLCALTSYAVLVLMLLIADTVLKVGPITSSVFRLPLPRGVVEFNIYIDGLALIPTLLSALFAALSMTFSLRYFSVENRYRLVSTAYNRAYSLMLIFLGSMIGACFSGDMVTILIFWEITGLCSYALVAFWHEDPVCRAAALKTFILTHIGTLGFLLGTVTIYPVVGTLNVHMWGQRILNASIVPVAMLFFLIGILPKAVQFPFHTWLPDATVAPTPVTAYVHVVGFLMGLYAFPRFFGQIFIPSLGSLPALFAPLDALFGGLPTWNFIISFIGSITVMIAAIFSILEREIKKLIAYCLISSLGGTVMALGLGTPLGIAAGLFSMIPHVLYCGLLFFAAGAAIYRTGKTSIDDMGGLQKTMPVTTICGAIGVLSCASFPFLGYFTAFWLTLQALIEIKAVGFFVIAFLGSILKTAAVLRMFHSSFLGNSQKNKREFKESPLFMLFPMIFLSIFILVFGVFPQLFLNSLILPATQHLGMDVGLVATLDDIITSSGLWSPTLGAIACLSYLGIVFGLVLASSKTSFIREERSKPEEAVKPFLFGEDIDLLDHVSGYHVYYTMARVLRMDRLCNVLNVDRIYNKISRLFSRSCTRLLGLDVVHEYFPAVFAFLGGAMVIILVVILAG